LISGFTALEYEGTDQNDLNEEVDDCGNVRSSARSVQYDFENEVSGSIKNDDNIANGPERI